MEERKLNTFYCENCGKEIKAFGTPKIFLCLKCREPEKIQPKKKKLTEETQDLFDRVKTIRKYNEKHGTDYTYGIYALKEMFGQL